MGRRFYQDGSFIEVLFASEGSAFWDTPSAGKFVESRKIFDRVTYIDIYYYIVSGEFRRHLEQCIGRGKFDNGGYEDLENGVPDALDARRSRRDHHSNEGT